MSREFDTGPDLTRPTAGDRSVLEHCLNLICEQATEGTRGWAVEFGVGTGATLRMIAEVLPVIGFDSFLGLPEDWRPGFRKGHFAHEARQAPANIAGATIVAGWFDDTVPDYDWPDDIALVHFDADLYSSTITALNSIGPHLKPGCILIFDEFHGYDDDFEGTMPGEQQAFWEYVSRPRCPVWSLEVIGHGREQWAVRLR